MNFEPFAKLLKHLFKIGTERGDYVPVLAWGESGVGKSEVVKRVTKELEVGFVDLRLGQMEVGDLIGLPREETVYPCAFCLETAEETPFGGHRYTKRDLLQHLREAHAHDARLGGIADPMAALQTAIDEATERFAHLVDIRTVHLMPQWFPEQGTTGILFLDELNRSHLEARQAVFQLILDRRMHRHTLPRGWIIVSAVNPATEDYQVDELYDKAFLARFLHIAFEPTAAEWLEYAGRVGVDWSIRALVSEDGKFLGDLSAKLPRVRPTPRCWSLLDKLMDGIPPDLEQEVAAGLVGPEAATAWLKLRSSTERPVKADDVLADYDKVRGRVKAYASTKGNRNDLLKVTLDDLARITEERETLADAELNGLCRFVLDCPKDLAYAYLKLRFIRNPRLRRRLSARDDLYEFVARINKEAGVSA